MGLNIFGEAIEPCSKNPLTGFFRDGCCNTSAEDLGEHTICVITTQDFLDFSFSRGNDLISPRPLWQFDGLKPGDRWCLCLSRWEEARVAGFAPLVVLEATHESVLEKIPMETLLKFAYKGETKV